MRSRKTFDAITLFEHFPHPKQHCAADNQDVNATKQKKHPQRWSYGVIKTVILDR
jgi:hypothetical protein